MLSMVASDMNRSSGVLDCLCRGRNVNDGYWMRFQYQHICSLKVCLQVEKVGDLDEEEGEAKREWWLDLISLNIYIRFRQRSRVNLLQNICNLLLKSWSGEVTHVVEVSD